MSAKIVNSIQCKLFLLIISAIPYAAPVGCLDCQAQTNLQPKALNIQAVETEIRYGFYMGLLGIKKYSTNNTSVDDEIVVFTWTTNSPTWAVSVPKEVEYFCKIELFDSDGKAVKKTAAGKKIGSKFLEFNEKHQGIIIKQRYVDRKNTQMSAPNLFYPYKPRDLFIIDKPGTYTLKVWLQLLAVINEPGQDQHKAKLIRFDPLSYPLVNTNNLFR
jgi:hypothetical protein